MTSLAGNLAGSKFCVVLHDMTPIFAAEIDRLLDALQPLVRDRLVGAIVPQWHGNVTSESDRRFFGSW